MAGKLAEDLSIKPRTPLINSLASKRVVNNPRKKRKENKAKTKGNQKYFNRQRVNSFQAHKEQLKI